MITYSEYNEMQFICLYDVHTRSIISVSEAANKMLVMFIIFRFLFDFVQLLMHTHTRWAQIRLQ